MQQTSRKRLECICGASAKDTPTERGRFLRRHITTTDDESPEAVKHMAWVQRCREYWNRLTAKMKEDAQ